MNVEITGETVKTIGLVYHKVHDRPLELNGVDSVMVLLGPYDNSDALEIKYLPDTNEVVVLHHGSVTKEDSECVFSIMLEEL